MCIRVCCSSFIYVVHATCSHYTVSVLIILPFKEKKKHRLIHNEICYIENAFHFALYSSAEVSFTFNTTAGWTWRMGSEKHDVCHHGNWSRSELFQVKSDFSSLQAPVKPLSDWKSACFQEEPGCASLFDPRAVRRKAQQSWRLTDEIRVQVSNLTSEFLCKSFIDRARNKDEE